MKFLWCRLGNIYLGIPIKKHILVIYYGGFVTKIQRYNIPILLFSSKFNVFNGLGSQCSTYSGSFYNL